MISRAATPPPGYVRARVGGAEAVALPELLAGISEILAVTSLYAHAALHPARRQRMGRAPVYIVPLSGSSAPVVVRHSWHGGGLARLTGDRFLPPTRAPHELAMSLRLAALDIPTPLVVAYAVYPAGPVLRRSDVITREIPDSADLATILTGTSTRIARSAAMSATTVLLSAMARAGVRHPDLNLKNILIAAERGNGAAAYLLDVDRVHIDTGRARAASANAARLMRSARKWRDRHGAPITDVDLEMLEAAALGAGA